MRLAVIVGAGIGGLAAGIALRRAGWRVQIFERSPVHRAIGFALGLAPNAMAAMRELGVDQAVRAHAIAPLRAELRRPDGRLLKRVDLSRVSSREQQTMIVMRPVLHGALADAVGRDHIRFDCEVAGFDVSDDRVTVRLRDGHSAECDLLVGADGVASAVRRCLRPEEASPRRSGYWAIRGAAFGADGPLGALDAVAYLGNGMESMTVRAGRNAIYWYLSILASDLPADTLDARTVFESLTTGFEGKYHAITRATKDEDIRLDELFDRDPTDRWGAGPVTLLGDAAHPMLPHTGQGAAQALEDAVALGLALSNGQTGHGLRAYERVRARRTGAIVRQGRRIARVTTTHNRVVQGLRDTAIRLVPGAVIAGALALGGRKDPHRKLRSR